MGDEVLTNGGMARRLRDALNRNRLILFDLDDTLCDYSLARMRRLSRAFGDAFRSSGQDLTEADRDALIARSIAIHPHGVDHFPELLANYGLADGTIVAAQVWYRTNSLHDLALFAEATAALAAVRNQSGVPGLQVGIITNGPAGIQRAKIDLLGIEPLVDFIVVSGEFGVEKPDPAIFRESLRLGNAKAGEAVYIGDSAEHDIAGARAAGLTAVWVNRDGDAWVAGDAPPDLVIRNVSEIVAALVTT